MGQAEQQKNHVKTSAPGGAPEPPRRTRHGSLWSLLESVLTAHIPVYAGNAAFFLILSVLPLTALLLGLVSYLPIEQEDLLRLIARVLPDSAVTVFRYLFGMNDPRTVISVSAVTMVWSASRGTYGIQRGLNHAYELRETRGYLRVRLQCVLDTLLLLLAFLAALLLSVFGRPVAEFLRESPLSFLINPATQVLFAAAVLILLFSLLYLILPDHRVHFRAVLPGAVLAGLGWMVYSELYSLYVAHFSGLNRLYGGLTTLAVTMLWLYVCTEILFFGGVVNRWLAEK